MSEKASGNEKRPSKTPEKENKPIGDEVPVDPQAGDLLDPVDRWWSDAPTDEEGEESPRNRKLDPEEMAVVAEKARQREEEIARRQVEEAKAADSSSDEESNEEGHPVFG